MATTIEDYGDMRCGPTQRLAHSSSSLSYLVAPFLSTRTGTARLDMKAKTMSVNAPDFASRRCIEFLKFKCLIR